MVAQQQTPRLRAARADQHDAAPEAPVTPSEAEGCLEWDTPASHKTSCATAARACPIGERCVGRRALVLWKRAKKSSASTCRR